MKKRALRRHHLKRMKKKAIKVFRSLGYSQDRWAVEHGTKIANHMQCCSCMVCGNLRRTESGKNKLTRGERNIMLSEKEQREEF
jgi:hypothetical protein